MDYSQLWIYARVVKAIRIIIKAPRAQFGHSKNEDNLKYPPNNLNNCVIKHNHKVLCARFEK